MFENILFPTDGSSASLQAVDAVASLALPPSALRVTVAVVVAPLSPEQGDYRFEYLEQYNSWQRQEARRAAERAVERLKMPGVTCTMKVIEGSPVSTVLAAEAASGHYDLIVMSSRGLGQQQDASRYVGNVTQHLLRRAGVPILVVPLADLEDDD